MVASLDPSDDVRTDENKDVTKSSTTTYNNSSSTTKSTNDDDDDDGNNNNNKKQEIVIPTGPVVPPTGNNEDFRLMPPPASNGMPTPSNMGAKLEEENVADEDNSFTSPAFIQKSNGNSNNTIPFIPKRIRTKILLEINKARVAEIRDGSGATSKLELENDNNIVNSTISKDKDDDKNVIVHDHEHDDDEIPKATDGKNKNETKKDNNEDITSQDFFIARRTNIETEIIDSDRSRMDQQKISVTTNDKSLNKQVMMQKESNQLLMKKFAEQELELSSLKDENSKKDKELESLKQEKLLMMQKEQRSETARKDIKTKNFIALIMSLVEKNKVGCQEINSSKKRN
jgi:hypothetical protein